MNKKKPYVVCKECGKDLTNFHKPGGNEPCPQCGSTSKTFNMEGRATGHITAHADVKVLSPLSPFLLPLIEFHSQKGDDNDELREVENAMGIIVWTQMFLETFIYESFVAVNLISDEDYKHADDFIRYQGREQIKQEIISNHNELRGEIGRGLELKYYYLLKENLNVDLYDDLKEFVGGFQELIDVRNSITHFKEYNVTSVENEERLRSKLNMDNASRLRDNALGLRDKISQLIKEKST